MKGTILTVTALAFSLSSFAGQPQSTVLMQGKANLTGMTSIEDKNRSIMSNYQDYYQLSQQNKLLKKDRIQQQYGQFVGKKSQFSNTAGL